MNNLFLESAISFGIWRPDLKAGLAPRAARLPWEGFRGRPQHSAQPLAAWDKAEWDRLRQAQAWKQTSTLGCHTLSEKGSGLESDILDIMESFTLSNSQRQFYTERWLSALSPWKLPMPDFRADKITCSLWHLSVGWKGKPFLTVSRLGGIWKIRTSNHITLRWRVSAC